MKKVLFLLSVCAVLVALLAPPAFATQHGGMATATATTATATAPSIASPTATAATAQYAQYATATASPPPTTGGPSLGTPVGLLAALALVGSGMIAVFVRRSSA